MQYLTGPELRDLLTTAYHANRRHHLFLVTVFWHGSRVSETLKIKGSNVVNGKLFIQRGKGSVSTNQDIHIEDDPIFDCSPLITLAKANPNTRLFQFTRGYIDTLVKRYGKRAGIDRSKLHIHALKHTTAIVLWKASGGNLGFLQRHLGHKVAASSLIYLYEMEAQKASDVMNTVRL